MNVSMSGLKQALELLLAPRKYTPSQDHSIAVAAFGASDRLTFTASQPSRPAPIALYDSVSYSSDQKTRDQAYRAYVQIKEEGKRNFPHHQTPTQKAYYLAELCSKLQKYYPIFNPTQEESGEAQKAWAQESQRRYPNQAVQQYAQNIVDRLTKELKTPLRYQIMVVNSMEANAFTPGSGKIILTTSQITQVKDEAELAGILAHEIIHSEKRHALKGHINRGLMTEFLRGDPQADKIMKMANSLGSRVLEREADRESLHLMKQAGYDLQARLRLLERIAPMDQQSVQNMKRDLHPEAQIIQETHPTAMERLNNLQQQLQTISTGGRAENGADRHQRILQLLG